jgi:hypothetical protein
VLLDPRFTTNSEAFFCDDFSIDDLFKKKHAILVNGSKAMDMPLQRWKNASGDVVSTIRGYFIDRNRDGIPDPDSTFPDLNGTGTSNYRNYIANDGMVLRNLPGTLLETQMKPLYMQNFGAPGDHYISDIGAGRSDPAFEGYSFLDPVPLTTEGLPVLGVTPLSLCAFFGGLDTRLVSSTGCTNFVKSLSYALPAP